MPRQIITPRFTVRPCDPGFCVYDELTGQIAGEALFYSEYSAERACAVANDVAITVHYETLKEMADLKEERELHLEVIE